MVTEKQRQRVPYDQKKLRECVGRLGLSQQEISRNIFGCSSSLGYALRVGHSFNKRYVQAFEEIYGIKPEEYIVSDQQEIATQNVTIDHSYKTDRMLIDREKLKVIFKEKGLSPSKAGIGMGFGKTYFNSVFARGYMLNAGVKLLEITYGIKPEEYEYIPPAPKPEAEQEPAKEEVIEEAPETASPQVDLDKVLEALDCIEHRLAVKEDCDAAIYEKIKDLTKKEAEILKLLDDAMGALNGFLKRIEKDTQYLVRVWDTPSV